MSLAVEFQETVEGDSPSGIPKTNVIHENDVLDTGDGIPAGVLGESEYPAPATDFRPPRASGVGVDRE